MPATQAFVLMNLDLIAVPLQVGGAFVTIYCGALRAAQLCSDSRANPMRAAEAPRREDQALRTLPAGPARGI